MSYRGIYSRCYQCGYCCQVEPCAFGTWNKEKHQCSFLRVEEQLAPGIAQYSCLLYRELVKNPAAKLNPAFHAGCCSALCNTQREHVIAFLEERKKKMNKGFTLIELLFVTFFAIFGIGSSALVIYLIYLLICALQKYIAG